MNKLLPCFSTLAFSLLLLGCLGGGAGSSSNVSNVSSAGGQVASGFNAVVNGSRVTVDYVGTLENGTLFDTSIAAEAKKAGLTVPDNLQPLEFVVGSGVVIKGFDKAVLGMKVGEEKTVTIPPEEGYGQSSKENVVTINASQLDQSGGVPKAGMQVSSAFGTRGTIIAVGNGTVTIDFNPPLAGKTLVFKIILGKIG